MELKAEKRTILGKATRALRAKGIIPGELYGHKTENVHISVSEKDFRKVYKAAGTNTVITLVIDGKPVQALIAHTAKDHLKQTVIAIDFHEVKKGEKLVVTVPIELIGIAPAVKLGKTVMQALQEIEVEATADKIPHILKADISKLEHEGQAVHVSDIKIPEGVKLVTHKDIVVATVAEQAKEEVKEEKPAEATPATPAKPEKTQEKK